MKFNYLKKKLISLAIFATSLIFILVLMEGILVFSSTEDKDSYGFTKEFHKKYIRYNKHGYNGFFRITTHRLKSIQERNLLRC